MKGWMAMAAALALAASPAWAGEKARAKDGGGSKGSSAGSRHHSGSGSSARSSSGGERREVEDRDSRESSRTPTAAQLRHPRAGTGSGSRGHRFSGRRWSHYDPWYSYGWYGWYRPYGYGYGWYWPSYSSGFYGYQPYPHRYGYSSYRAGSLRVLVKPSDTKVYVDGYYAGIADDFDGLFQRLHLAPGRHDIALKLDGYRTHQIKVYVPYESTIKLHHRMVRGSGAEPTEDVLGRPEDLGRYGGDTDEFERDERFERDRDADLGGERGVVRLDVRPGDASVYVDGGFRGTGRDLRRLRLTPGRHRIEVVRPGYRTIERHIEVRRGETIDVDVELERS